MATFRVIGAARTIRLNLRNPTETVYFEFPASTNVEVTDERCIRAFRKMTDVLEEVV